MARRSRVVHSCVKRQSWPLSSAIRVRMTSSARSSCLSENGRDEFVPDFDFGSVFSPAFLSSLFSAGFDFGGFRLFLVARILGLGGLAVALGESLSDRARAGR